jgi:predicted aspartyl protease
MLVDTDATNTIVRPDVLGDQTTIPTTWRLRTATVVVHGDINAKITLGTTTLRYRVIIADIKEEVILGMDILSSHGAQVDFFKDSFLRINNEEILLNPRENISVHAIITVDTTLKNRSEAIVRARLEGDPPLER